MNQRSKWLSTVAVIACAVLTLVMSQTSSASSQGKKVNRYVGAQKCKNCHDSAETGAQFEALHKMKHAQAFATLAGEDAKKLAAAKGIADPQKDDKCVKCHVTAFGVPEEQIAKGFDKTIGVQCESCHGPGELHMKARMAAAADEEEGEGFGEASASKGRKYVALPAGEIVVDPPMSTCLGCHNAESPSFKPFCFHKAKHEIRHLNPLKPRTAEEKAKLLECGCGEKCACVNGCEEGKCGVAPKEGK